ncbi:MAG: DegT/DnrJ/EryC1/StrS family aminotransferase [candidate division WS1 bacterium]|nr:DegT/DnrJ/EryC1/StrS family aminotransferase [candidate division WS1 bacterium]
MSEALALHGGDPAVPEGLVDTRWPVIDDADREAVVRALEWPSHTAGSPEVKALVEEWSAWQGAKYCLATNSGTAALHMAVAAVGIEPGDEVITSAFSWTSTATSVLHHNAIPIFVDIDPVTISLDPKLIDDAVTDHTKAVIVPHLHGLSANMDPVLEACQCHGLRLIEDCCQSHGAKYRGKKVGTMGDVAAFSLNQNKNLAAGEGGFLTTDDEEVYEKAARLWQFGEVRRPDGTRDMNAHGMGWMYRTAGLPASFARSQLTKLEGNTRVFQENARFLSAALAEIPGVEPPAEPEGYEHVYYNYAVRFQPQQLGLEMDARTFREKVSEALNAEGVKVAPWWNIALPDMVLFQNKDGYGKGCPWSCPHTRQDISYENLDLPETRRWLDEYSLVRHLHAPNDLQVMKAYVAAFDKVFSNLDVVLA